MTNKNHELIDLLDAALSRAQQKHKLADIARQLGYEKSNILSMFRTGTTKVPLDKAVLIAKVLEIDPPLFLRLALEQSVSKEAVAEMITALSEMDAPEPDSVPESEPRQMADEKSKITANEMAIIKYIREASGGVNPKLTFDMMPKLSEVFAPRFIKKQ